ncbi:PROTEIN NEN3 [Salix koriyanagi]|uniref:PROTEIN NEN3 n=1 Tax=Salix koriyanagi TaxID=2511006 RepID=A0A9Q0PHM4_9ROSI|nr:PROTEIN NEN3 [Salix koriyanagi]
MENKTEIAFFDLETTRPTPPGQGLAILEFGAILVCHKKLVELRTYSTLVRPSNPKLVSSLSVRCNGITPEAVISAPSFADIADTVYDILHGRIWAGHNIDKFDGVLIREAFAEIGRTAPEPQGTIDTLALLTQKFGRRAGNMKMASLATYFGLGNQTHRSLDDVKMNIKVLKHCATVLFLESSLPDIFPENHWVHPDTFEKVLYSVPFNTAHPDTFDMVAPGNEMNAASHQPDVTMEENPILQPPEMPSTVTVPESCSDSLAFLEPDEVSLPSIRALHVPFSGGSQRVKLFYEGAILQLCCPRLRIRIVQKVYADSGCSSEWTCVVSKRHYPTVRLQMNSHHLSLFSLFIHDEILSIPTAVNGDVAQYATDMYLKEPSGTTQKLIFSKFDATELDTVFKPGTFVDSYLSLNPYDYQQRSGIQLVATKLVIHNE